MEKDTHGLSSFACDPQTMGQFAQRLGLEPKPAAPFLGKTPFTLGLESDIPLSADPTDTPGDEDMGGDLGSLTLGLSSDNSWNIKTTTGTIEKAQGSIAGLMNLN